MTLQSRRKHPIILSNMSPENAAELTQLSSVGTFLHGLGKWSRVMLAVAALAGPFAFMPETDAQEASGRSRVNFGDTESGGSAGKASLEAARQRALKRQSASPLKADRIGTRSSNALLDAPAPAGVVTASAASEEVTQPAAKSSQESAPELASESGEQLRRSLENGITGRPVTWKYYYGQRLRSVLGHSDTSLYDEADSDEPGFIEDHLLAEEVDPEVDVYDSKPILVELGPLTPADDPSIADESNATAQEGDSTKSKSLLRLNRDIATIEPTLDYATRGIEARRLPPDFYEKMDHGEYVPRKHSPVVFQWAPTNLYHHPLYFEDPGLERYGHTYHPIVQPFASTGKFAHQFITLPYQMALNPVHSKDYTLGWYRPGDCAPKKTYILPFNEEASVVHIATMATLILIIP
ncbi:MAG: hypothetical protein JNL58_21025 [Planctomyces sp.]|nr:hypothetical protein [Planctomyces sp.]